MRIRLYMVLALSAALVWVTGCGNNVYVDDSLGIEVQRIDSDLEDRWSTNGVVVKRILPGSPAEGQLQEGELITYIVGHYDATTGGNVNKALERALDKDRAAVLLLSDGRRIEIGSRRRGESLGLRIEGNRVTKVEPGSAAMLAGLQVGDQIQTVIDEKRITGIKAYKKAVNEIHGYASGVTFYTNELSVIKLAAIQALGALGDPRALKPLIQALEGKEVELRQPAAQALEQLSKTVTDPALVEAMIAHLDDPDPEIRRSSAAVLGRLRVEKAIPNLLLALEDPIPGVRFRAGLALSQIGAASLDGLIDVLSTGSPITREIAASALGDIGGSRARIALVRSPDGNTTLSFRLAAADALGRIATKDDPQALVALQQVARDATDAGLRVFVEELITKLTGAASNG